MRAARVFAASMSRVRAGPAQCATTAEEPTQLQSQRVDSATWRPTLVARITAAVALAQVVVPAALAAVRLLARYPAHHKTLSSKTTIASRSTFSPISDSDATPTAPCTTSMAQSRPPSRALATTTPLLRQRVPKSACQPSTDNLQRVMAWKDHRCRSVSFLSTGFRTENPSISSSRVLLSTTRVMSMSSYIHLSVLYIMAEKCELWIFDCMQLFHQTLNECIL